MTFEPLNRNRTIWNCRRLRSGNIRGNIIFIFAAQKSLRAFLSCFFTKKGRKGKRAYPTVKVIRQNTRAKIDKLHKGIMNRNVQNKKIKYLENKQLHAAGRSKTNRKINLFRQKTEKWLDNRGFGVYTALVSHNGLVRQKGSLYSTGRKAREEKFVKNAETFPSTRVELCVSAQI